MTEPPAVQQVPYGWHQVEEPVQESMGEIPEGFRPDRLGVHRPDQETGQHGSLLAPESLPAPESTTNASTWIAQAGRSRSLEPVYRASGLMSRLSAACSITWAVQPAWRASANVAGNRSGVRPTPMSTGAA
jgi:hypothetical protein